MLARSSHEIRHKSLTRIFGVIPGRYDLINHLFTWGMDRRWRRQLVASLLKNNPRKVLDIGCGTGDLCLSIALQSQESVNITGYDFSQPMLKIAARKAKELAPDKKITFIHGDVAQMPFPDAMFDCVAISFALRNLIFQNPAAEKHLCEIRRILKTGGIFFSVESSQPHNKIIRSISHLYLRTYVYGIGALISGDREAYQYLVQSAIHFYTPEELEKRFLAAGFRQFSHQPLFFGAAGINQVMK